MAIRARRPENARLLLAYGVSIDRDTFFEATQSESVTIWQCLVNNGWAIDDTRYGSTALRMSCSSPALVRWFCEQGADVDLRGRDDSGRLKASPIASALAENAVDSIRVLLEYGAKLEPDLFNKLLAPFMDDEITVDTLQLLLDAGLDPNATFRSGPRGGWICTPLQAAVRYKLYDKAQALVLAGANPTVVNEKGQTLLDEAVASGDQVTVHLVSAALEKWDAGAPA